MEFDWTLIAWVLLVLSFVLAGFGTLLPGLPGAALVVAAMIFHKVMMPDYFSWWVVIIVGALGALSWIVDILGGVWGAKLGGATREGLIGAAIGGVVGVFFGLPGLILGPFFGAIMGDIYAKRSDYWELFRSGVGAATGFIVSLIARFALLFAQALVVAISIVWH